MKKKDLLKIINTSILKINVPTTSIYKKYYPLICEILKDFKDKEKITNLDGFEQLHSANAFDIFIRSNTSEDIEKFFRSLVNELRRWARGQEKNIKLPDGVEQKRMREDVINKINVIADSLKFATDEVVEPLYKAKEILSIMFLPKTDIRITEYYNRTTELLDNFDMTMDLRAQKEIAEQVLINIELWKNLSR